MKDKDLSKKILEWLDKHYWVDVKECIRCWTTQKEVKKEWSYGCYVWWWSYTRHDYSKPLPLPKDWLFIKPKKRWK